MAFTDRRERIPATLPAAGARSSFTGATAIALGLALGIFLFYFLAYPIRHLTLPVGFDPPWYVWRAEHLTALGVGNGELAARPGYPVLSAILGSLTGLSQLETTVVLSLVLVSLLALAVGAFARAGLGFDRWRWGVVVATTAVVLGPTHLVGENLSNALNIALEIAAVVPLAAFIGGKGGMAAAVVLLVASGLAHWDFVALFGVVLGVAFLMALPSSQRERARGVTAIRTESGALAALAAWSGSILLVLVGGVLRAPLRTIEIGNDELLFRRKFRTDVARLIVPAVAGLVGPWVLSGAAVSGAPGRCRRFAVRLLQAWTYVMAAGMVVGLLSFAVPPARFLAHLVALPGAITVGAGVSALAMWARRWTLGPGRSAGRWPAIASLGVTAVVLAALAVPGVLRWYRYPVLLEPAAVQQARTADRYLAMLPPHQPVVFLLDYRGRPGSLSAVLKERTIRMGLSPQRQLDAHFFVGALPDLLRGQRTPAPDERAEQFTRRYWEDVRPLLATQPAVVILRAMAQAEYREAISMGARVVAPDVTVLRGPAPPGEIAAAPLPKEVPSLLPGIGYGLAVLALLWVAGAGWTRALVGPRHAPETLAAMAPVMGTAMLMLGGLAAAELEVRLSLAGAVVTYLVVSLSGLAAALVPGGRSEAH
ncbi:MAG TPA: hypothetical protein VGL18_06655 [Actinomycetota bacterium]